MCILSDRSKERPAPVGPRRIKIQTAFFDSPTVIATCRNEVHFFHVYLPDIRTNKTDWTRVRLIKRKTPGIAQSKSIDLLFLSAY